MNITLTDARNRTISRTKSVFGSIVCLVVALEIFASFVGPMAFLRKPTLVVFPPFSAGISREETKGVHEYVEREIAATKSYAIVSYGFIEEYFVRNHPERVAAAPDGSLAPTDYKEAKAIAQDLEIERFVIVTAWKGLQKAQVSLSLRNTRDGELLRSKRIDSATLEDILAGVGLDGADIDVGDEFVMETRGIGVAEFLIFGLFAAQLAFGVLVSARRDPAFLAEIVFAWALVLFVFAFVHSLSANMDYVQRYIANGGRLRLAQSTAAEQLRAILRFAPILLLNAVWYIWNNARRRESGESSSLLHRIFGRWSLPWTLMSAALFAFSFPSVLSLDGFGVLAWVAMIPLFCVIVSNRYPASVFYGIVFGTLQALIINYWHGTYNYVTLHLMTIAFFVEYVLFMIPYVFVLRRSGKWGFLVAPAGWILFEFLRSSGLLAYPWGLLGATQYRLIPLIQIASFTGVWGVGFLVVLANACLAWFIVRLMRGDRLARLSGSHVADFLPLIVIAASFSVSLATGAIILSQVQKRIDRAESSATVLLLQQNTDPRKHAYGENLERLMELTDAALATMEIAPDLIAWPEGGFPLDVRFWTREANQNRQWARVVKEFLEYQKSTGVWLATGTQDHIEVALSDGESERRNFNSSVLLDPSGQIAEYYHKIRLVPFSEYFPLDRERFSGLYEVFQEYDISNWTKGEERVVYQHETLRFFTPLCFEDVFPDHIRRFVRRDADVILNMSNDYWSLSPVEGRQHAMLALFRAVENQRPVLRTTCSGHTVHIDAAGRIMPGAPEPYTPGHIVAKVPLTERHLTFYTRYGDWFPVACAVIFIIAFVFSCFVKVGRGDG